MTKKSLGIRTPLMSLVLALLFLSGQGCTGGPDMQMKQAISESAPPSAPRPVTADQIDAQNARAQVQAVRDEMAREH
jgi:hypothetical protein